MGLLDDAIRQHLELKRRHGADPSAVARLEQEAFGPSELAEPIAMPADDASEDDHAVAREEEVAYEEAELEADEEWAARHPAEPDARAEPVVDEDLAPEPEAAAPEVPRAGGSVRLDDVGERTVEFSSVEPEPEPSAAPEPRADVEPDPQPDAEPGEHDELEETPEFLQETPEHDRLWFEQKPPRDFDF